MALYLNRVVTMKYLIHSLILIAVVLSSCVKQSKDLELDKNNEHHSDFYLVPETNPQASEDTQRQKLSSFFLVEQFSVNANQSMLLALKKNPPGGVLFWNGNAADSEKIKEAINAYSKQAQKFGVMTPLFSTDYEGGAYNKTPFNSSIPGVQRFSIGFTKLVHPRWLGESMKMFGLEMCQLHGKILAKELKAVGINYPLSVVSDLATQSLTLLRGISKDSKKVSECVVEIVKQFIKEDNIVFVTKHFPGIGLTRGDTHDGIVTSTELDPIKLNNHLKPFLDLINFSKQQEKEHILSIMTTHAMFKGYDSQNLTTESRAVITELLKEKLEFKGLTVSDAMWMGDYGYLASKELMPIYLKAFLSGIDLLMIPGNRFKESVGYFRKVYDRKLSKEEGEALENKMEMGVEEVYDLFEARVEEAIETHEQVRGKLKYPHEFIETKTPVELTEKEQARYFEILQALSK